ncbi:hypothetical protein EVAR_89428_1 [Eumeta japonica]|uniref:Uncharacterized protein n=1 Tax=Eumeta variegata TaxID=151549 RepID=A0A4C1Z593_EUMVA|nr:hypothetical protein EVAR_89428_1 [Eumeta japonica]
MFLRSATTHGKPIAWLRICRRSGPKITGAPDGQRAADCPPSSRRKAVGPRPRLVAHAVDGWSIVRRAVRAHRPSGFRDRNSKTKPVTAAHDRRTSRASVLPEVVLRNLEVPNKSKRVPNPGKPLTLVAK